MYIGACRMTFALPGNRSLKGKRHVVRRVCDRIRHKFHAAAAEVGDSEAWNEAEVGFSVISGNETHARTMAENIVDYIDGLMLAPLREVELEIIPFDELALEGTFNDVEQWGDEGAAKLGDMTEKEG